jgi:hypothetical protein
MTNHHHISSAAIHEAQKYLWLRDRDLLKNNEQFGYLEVVYALY